MHHHHRLSSVGNTLTILTHVVIFRFTKRAAEQIAQSSSQSVFGSEAGSARFYVDEEHFFVILFVI